MSQILFLWVFKSDFNFLNSNIDPRNVYFVTLTSFIGDFLHANNFSFKFNNEKVDIRCRYTFIPSILRLYICTTYPRTIYICNLPNYMEDRYDTVN